MENRRKENMCNDCQVLKTCMILLSVSVLEEELLLSLYSVSPATLNWKREPSIAGNMQQNLVESMQRSSTAIRNWSGYGRLVRQKKKKTQVCMVPFTWDPWSPVDLIKTVIRVPQYTLPNPKNITPSNSDKVLINAGSP